MSIFMQFPPCYWCSVESLNSIFLTFHNCFWSFIFPAFWLDDFRINFLICTEKFAMILIRIVLNLSIQINIFKILSFLTHEQGISLHLFQCSLIFSAMFYSFQCTDFAYILLSVFLFHIFAILKSSVFFFFLSFF